MTTKTNNAKRKPPTHRLYHVAGDGPDAIWSQVAAAWPHADGKGFTIPVPFLGRIVMREIGDKADDQGALL
ncbi:hypothetical protein QO010_003361 [Caulobacter ginsengisoli]|uniref:Uncharacterized protein n=1 Tax=Caulobacter ginsengisoli TaxID=400775 RepID=A0ABU0IX89_9CAUL|nr:hypothetical protein [Caulobacter ginsengisoli]MDQ0465572.1 hypothetical protein [Caulobacter ginsengisoli]